MTPVLFLDFDGPLFPENHIMVSPGITEYPGTQPLHPWVTYWHMSNTSVRMLNLLYSEYQFDTVVSSSWQQYHDRPQIEELFRVNGLELHLHEDWATVENPLRSYRGRGSEIRAWLRNHTVDGIAPAHIILDDPWSGGELENWRLLPPLQEPFIIDPNVGIDPEAFKSMRKVVREWSNNYESRTISI